MMVVVISIKFIVCCYSGAAERVSPARVDVDQSLACSVFSSAHSVVSPTVDRRNRDLCDASI